MWTMLISIITVCNYCSRVNLFDHLLQGQLHFKELILRQKPRSRCKIQGGQPESQGRSRSANVSTAFTFHLNRYWIVTEGMCVCTQMLMWHLLYQRLWVGRNEKDVAMLSFRNIRARAATVSSPQFAPGEWMPPTDMPKEQWTTCSRRLWEITETQRSTADYVLQHETTICVERNSWQLS
jgi:hypothetical protein